MIRILLTSGNKAYGFDVTDWEILTEDLVERVDKGDILMYINSNESAKDWCKNNGYEYEFVDSDDDN